MELAAEMHDYIKEDLVHLFPSLKVPASAASIVVPAANAAIAVAPVVAAAAINAAVAHCDSACCFCCSCGSQTALLGHIECCCPSMWLQSFLQLVCVAWASCTFLLKLNCRDAAGGALVFWQSTCGRQTAEQHRSILLTLLFITSSCIMTPVLMTCMATMRMLILPMPMLMVLVLISCRACITREAWGAKQPSRLWKCIGD